jgi:hypothetical protein
MEKLFESFNFSKKSEKKRASKELTPKEQETLIKESHAFALKRNRHIKKESVKRNQEKTPGQIDKAMQEEEDYKMNKYKKEKKIYDDARFKDWEYGGIHLPVNRPTKPSFKR